jgi:predicted RNA-binding Zn ribbon-like protein
VQLLINSIDLHAGTDWIDDWLGERGVSPRRRRRARELREALRALVLAHNGEPLDRAALATFNGAARRVSLQVGSDGELEVGADDDPLDRVVAIAFGAMLDGTFERLKACRHCRWAFYDNSPNRSATWCSMQLCGNRAKTRSYRRRRSAAR